MATASPRLQSRQVAPPFAARDVFDRPLRLADYRGGKLLLSFYRYASCPLCSLRVHSLLEHLPAWQAAGLEVVAVFESPAAHIRRYLDRHAAPFPIVPDPMHLLYRAYGVQPSWGGFMRAWLQHLPMVYEAVVRNGFLPGRMDGHWAMLPADFLIGPDLRIAEAYYGTHIGDHLPCARIERFVTDARDLRPHVPEKGDIHDSSKL